MVRKIQPSRTKADEKTVLSVYSASATPIVAGNCPYDMHHHLAQYFPVEPR